VGKTTLEDNFPACLIEMRNGLDSVSENKMKRIILHFLPQKLSLAFVTTKLSSSPTLLQQLKI